MAGSHDYVSAATERPSLGNRANRWKGLVALTIITFVQEPVSELQENDVSWILVDSGSAVTARPPTHAQEVPLIRGPERVFTKRWHEPQD